MNASTVIKYSNCSTISGLYCFLWPSFHLRMHLLMFLLVKSYLSGISRFFILRAMSNFFLIINHKNLTWNLRWAVFILPYTIVQMYVMVLFLWFSEDSFFFNVTILSRDISCPYRIKLHKRLKRSRVKSSFYLLMAVGVLSWISGSQNFTCYFF